MGGHTTRRLFVLGGAVLAGLALAGTAFGWRDVSIQDRGFVSAIVSGDR